MNGSFVSPGKVSPLKNEEIKKAVGKNNFVRTNEYYELKTRVHDRLINVLNLSLIDSIEETRLRQEIKKLVERILAEQKHGIPLNYQERENFLNEIQDEVLGLGPLEPLMQDPTVSDVLINTHKQIFVERSGRLEITEARFKDDAHLRRIID